MSLTKTVRGMYRPGGMMKFRDSQAELLRDYLHRFLYDQEHGFFSTVPILEGPHMNFGRLKNLEEYSAAVRAMQRGRGGKFVTPSELFRPWYGAAVAQWAISQRRADQLRIVEVGAGNGSTAEDCLRYLRRLDRETYQNCHYQIIEVSRSMAEQQRRRLVGYIDEGRVSIFEGSVLDWNELVEEPCCVVALEVLDNMPHDRVVIDEEYLFQSHVIWNEEEQRIRYEICPLKDELILRTGHYWQTKKDFRDPGGFSPKNVMQAIFKLFRALAPLDQTSVFLPTTAQRFLEVLRDYFPRHSLLLSDFDFLTKTVPGDNGPLVQSYNPERIFHCITAPDLHSADIIFPTNFSQLLSAYEEVCNKPAVVRTHEQFIHEHGHSEETLLQDGSNPMVNAYSNVRYLMTVPRDEEDDLMDTSAGHRIPPDLERKEIT